MAKMNQINGYAVEGIFGKSNRLINVGNVIKTASSKTGVNYKQIIKFFQNNKLNITTYSREKKSYGYVGSEVFTTKTGAEKIIEVVNKNIEEIKRIKLGGSKSKKQITLKNGNEIKTFESQIKAVAFLGYKRPETVTLKNGKTYRGWVVEK